MFLYGYIKTDIFVIRPVDKLQPYMYVQYHHHIGETKQQIIYLTNLIEILQHRIHNTMIFESSKLKSCILLKKLIKHFTRQC